MFWLSTFKNMFQRRISPVLLTDVLKIGRGTHACKHCICISLLSMEHHRTCMLGGCFSPDSSYKHVKWEWPIFNLLIINASQHEMSSLWQDVATDGQIAWSLLFAPLFQMSCHSSNRTELINTKYKLAGWQFPAGRNSFSAMATHMVTSLIKITKWRDQASRRIGVNRHGQCTAGLMDDRKTPASCHSLLVAKAQTGHYIGWLITTLLFCFCS